MVKLSVQNTKSQYCTTSTCTEQEPAQNNQHQCCTANTVQHQQFKYWCQYGGASNISSSVLHAPVPICSYKHANCRSRQEAQSRSHPKTAISWQKNTAGGKRPSNCSSVVPRAFTLRSSAQSLSRTETYGAHVGKGIFCP